MQIRIGIPIPATKGGHQPPSPGFEYPNASFCQDDGDQTPVITGTQGGVFSVSPSISGFNTTTGTIPGNSPAGTYNVTDSDYLVQADASSGPVQVNLPAVALS